MKKVVVVLVKEAVVPMVEKEIQITAVVVDIMVVDKVVAMAYYN